MEIWRADSGDTSGGSGVHGSQCNGQATGEQRVNDAGGNEGAMSLIERSRITTVDRYAKSTTLVASHSDFAGPGQEGRSWETRGWFGVASTVQRPF